MGGSTGYLNRSQNIIAPDWQRVPTARTGANYATGNLVLHPSTAKTKLCLEQLSPSGDGRDGTQKFVVPKDASPHAGYSYIVKDPGQRIFIGDVSNQNNRLAERSLSSLRGDRATAGVLSGYDVVVMS
jgi:hypothetical protein